MRRIVLGGVLGAMSLGAACPPVLAQKPIGTVSTADALVVNSTGGVVEASAGRATMLGSSVVTAKDHTAPVSLARGGEIRVCRSTAVHLTAAPDDSLQLALDRGAVEIHDQAMAGDVLLTPDLRFTPAAPGPLDLLIRVVVNGDTCVDNRGRSAPALRIADAFGESSYELKPGQHVTFEHGSLRQVVDRETTPCGCPPDDKRGVSLADAAVAGGARTGPVTPEQAAATHPFPAAVSEGLEDPAPPPPQTPGTTHVQVASTLAYAPNAPNAPNAPKGADEARARPAAAVEPEPAKKPGGGAFGAIGRFFKRLFVR